MEGILPTHCAESLRKLGKCVRKGVKCTKKGTLMTWECCWSRAAIMRLMMTTGGIEGKKNLCSANGGNLIALNIGVRTWPETTSVVRICGQ